MNKKLIVIGILGMFFLTGLISISAKELESDQDNKVSVSSNSWNIKVVDDNAEGHASIALDSSDRPHIAYSCDNNLLYAHHDEIEGWNSLQVGKARFYPELKIDKNDLLHMMYYGEENWRKSIWHATYTEESWETEKVYSTNTGPVGGYSFVLDKNNRVHICFGIELNGFDSNLKYAVSGGDGWNIESITMGGGGHDNPSLVVDSNNNPHVVYYKYTNGNNGETFLKYTYKNGEEWNDEDLTEKSTDDHISLSLAIDSSDNLHLIYTPIGVPGPNELIYKYYDGNSWQTEVLDFGRIGSLKVVLDSNDYPHIIYRKNSKIKYAYFDGNSWHKERVVSTGIITDISNPELVLDSKDHAHIVYVDMSDSSLIYAEKTEYRGTSKNINREKTKTFSNFNDRFLQRILSFNQFSFLSEILDMPLFSNLGIK